MLEQKPTDLEVHLRTARRFEQRIDRLTHAIMRESDASPRLQDESGFERLAQILQGLLFSLSVYEGQDRDLAFVSDAGGDRQRALRPRSARPSNAAA